MDWIYANKYEVKNLATMSLIYSSQLFFSSSLAHKNSANNLLPELNIRALRTPVLYYCIILCSPSPYRLNMDLQSLFWLHMPSCTHWLRTLNPPPPAFGLINEGAIGQPR